MNWDTRRTIARGGMLVALGLVMVATVLGYAYLKPTATASGPLSAIAVQPTAGGGTGAAVVFEIDQTTAQARYVIDEVLRGTPTTVVGKTDQVAGQLVMDPNDLDSAQLGTIQINARTLATDSSQRDRAVQNQVLLTDQYEFITFTPTALTGLPEELATGQKSSFQVAGDLTIRGITHPATFDVTLTPTSTSRLAGSATATIRFADWGISIPNVPFVADLEDQVRLELEFEAAAA